MKDFMLLSLTDEQRTLLRLMERARKAQAPEASTLAYALESVVGGVRDLRDNRIGWQQAVQVYQTACAVEHECELALIFARINLDGQRNEGEIGL